jgi:hypothetical protein
VDEAGQKSRPAFVLQLGKPWTIGGIGLSPGDDFRCPALDLRASLRPLCPLIPGHLFWAYAVGIAFIATTLSIVTHVKALLGSSIGVNVLYLGFILHLPRVVSASAMGTGTSMFVALAMRERGLLPGAVGLNYQRRQ